MPGPGRRDPHLPSYTGLSVDFSRTGLQLETRHALSPGRVMEPLLETHLEGMESIWVHARVAWCRMEGQKAFRSGLEFQPRTPVSRAQLERLEDYLHLRETADVNLLVLELAEH